MLKNKTVSKLFLTVFCCFVCLSTTHAESCESGRQYQVSGNCGYKVRECCDNKDYGKYWSPWAEDGETVCCSSGCPTSAGTCKEESGYDPNVLVAGSWYFLNCRCEPGSGWQCDRCFKCQAPSGSSCSGCLNMIPENSIPKLYRVSPNPCSICEWECKSGYSLSEDGLSCIEGCKDSSGKYVPKPSDDNTRSCGCVVCKRKKYTCEPGSGWKATWEFSGCVSGLSANWTSETCEAPNGGYICQGYEAHGGYNNHSDDCPFTYEDRMNPSVCGDRFIYVLDSYRAHCYGRSSGQSSDWAINVTCVVKGLSY